MYRSDSGQVHWWYFFGFFLYQTPLPVLVLIAIGVVDSLISIKKHPERMILFIWIAVPLLRIFVPNAALYDGLRHFMEILPSMVLFAAFGLTAMQKVGFRLLTSVIGFIAVVQLLFISVTYFPYSTGYYNALGKDPNKNFDRDIEALSIKEGIDYLHKRYGPIRAWVPIGAHLSWYYLTVPGDKYVYSADDADSIVLVNKSTHIRQDEFTPLVAPDFVIDHLISRGDAIFGWVYRRKSDK